MNRNGLTTVLLIFPLIVVFSTNAIAQEKAEVVYKSPSGAWQVEQSGDDVWVVSTKDTSQRAKLPPIDAIGPYPDAYHFSPNDEWIFGLRYGGSCLRDGDLFHRLAPDKIDMFESFNEAAWKNAVKLGAFKRDFSAEGFCAMTEFVSWSFDSARLLIELRGGEDKREMHEGYVYFNVPTKNFEVTNYLRKLNKAKSDVLACAEPVDPLPNEAELKTRFDSLDRQLNEKYTQVIGSSIATKARSFICRSFRRRRKSGVAFSFLAMSPPRGSVRPRRNGRLNGNRAQKQAIISPAETFPRSR